MNNKIIKILVPVIAVVVIFESVVLVSNLEKSSDSVVSEVTPVVNVKKEETAFDLNFTSDVSEMKIGKKYKVWLNLASKGNFNLNALDLYVKFDPEMVVVSNLVSTKELGKADFLKVSDKKNVLTVNYLFSASSGMSFIKDNKISLLSFDVVPKKAGMSYFEISTGDSNGDSVTMFVDKVTSKSLPFVSSKLEVNLVN